MPALLHLSVFLFFTGPTEWRDTLEKQDALEWTLGALDEDKEVRDFVERVPGFFDSKAVPDPTSAILPLMAN
ncbi:hypothetical protein EDB83DRAFT_2517323 [Lactarius deliciosus]|nr:hypothetical protein EDB83DRAFT_2517323 [Lactarius deliciosus]